MNTKMTKAKDEAVTETKDFFQNFKAFISKGNIMDMAIGVIIGAAFGKIVTSLVEDILMPIIGIFIGGYNFSSLSIKVGTATINYGNFIQNIINFIIIALCVYSMMRAMNKAKNKLSKKEEKKEEVKESEEVILLRQIRDELKK